MKTSIKSSAIIAITIGAIALTGCQSTQTTAAAPVVPSIALQDAQILEILPHRTSCQASAVPMQCLLAKTEGESDAQIFEIGYNSIKGFEPKVGMRYKIKAAQEINQHTAQPTGFWQLTEILTQHSK